MKGKYKAYPEYRESEVEWVGKIPTGWKLTRLKYISELKGKKVSGKSHLRYVGMENIESQTGRHITTTEPDHLGVSDEFTEGDVLFGKLRPYLAKSWLASFSGICSSEFLVLRSHKTSPAFLKYYTLIEEFINQVNGSTYGSKMPRASWDFIGLMDVPTPDFKQSQKIARFLDHETGKIDLLIEKQQELIALLKEKRQAVISHAVTKGLNPQAPLKDSGIEWLGQIPEHWETPKLSYRYEIQLGKMLDTKKVSGRFLGDYLRNTDVQWGEINFEGLPQMDFRPHERERYRIKYGDLIVCEGGEIGRASVWRHQKTIFYQKALHRLRPICIQKDSPQFMYYILFDSAHRDRFNSESEKATIAHLPADTFRQYRFAYPPLDEQIEIAEHLESLCKKYDYLELNAQSQITLLQERRTALISAAVTGKIDVRDWKAPSKASSATSATQSH